MSFFSFLFFVFCLNKKINRNDADCTHLYTGLCPDASQKKIEGPLYELDSPQTKISMSPMGSSSQGNNKQRRWALTRIVYQRPATQ